MMSDISYGCIVARLQVHELHEGQLALFREVMARHPRTILFLGVKPIGSTFKNPLDFETRKAMIREAFPEVTVEPLVDRYSDEVWSQSIDTQLAAIAGDSEVTLYGSRDSFIPYYSGKYKTEELDLPTCSDPTYSGTYIREKLSHAIQGSSDFRAGVIYAIANLRPQVKATVDVVITYNEVLPNDGNRGIRLRQHFLLGRKPNESQWRFIGGFSEPTTPSYEFDAVREAKEETGLDVGEPEFIGSALIPDWRWKGEPDQIKSLIFTAVASSMEAVGSDDIAEVKWFTREELNADLLIDTHKTSVFPVVKKHFNL
jgi:bifunctional NMN adenylyltransferase/nudix hydrolase